MNIKKTGRKAAKTITPIMRQTVKMPNLALVERSMVGDSITKRREP